MRSQQRSPLYLHPASSVLPCLLSHSLFLSRQPHTYIYIHTHITDNLSQPSESGCGRSFFPGESGPPLAPKRTPFRVSTPAHPTGCPSEALPSALVPDLSGFPPPCRHGSSWLPSPRLGACGPLLWPLCFHPCPTAVRFHCSQSGLYKV